MAQHQDRRQQEKEWTKSVANGMYIYDQVRKVLLRFSGCLTLKIIKNYQHLTLYLDNAQSQQLLEKFVSLRLKLLQLLGSEQECEQEQDIIFEFPSTMHLEPKEIAFLIQTSCDNLDIRCSFISNRSYGIWQLQEYLGSCQLIRDLFTGSKHNTKLLLSLATLLFNKYGNNIEEFHIKQMLDGLFSGAHINEQQLLNEISEFAIGKVTERMVKFAARRIGFMDMVNCFNHYPYPHPYLLN